MAAAEGNAGSVSAENEDGFEDPRMADGKKKKFKPFQKMKNFFRGSSKKRFKPDDGPKFHSTSALHAGTRGDEDDDEGGFRKTFAGSRSISEDSIFHQEQKDAPTIGVLSGQAVSMEGINKTFQSELSSKLQARQYSSDIDEGLSYGPFPPLSPSNPAYIRGKFQKSRHHKKKRWSVPESGTTSATVRTAGTQDSQQSLTSVDGMSDEDLFAGNWTSGAASVKSPKTRSSSADSLPADTTMDLDFGAVDLRQTKALNNDAAKHRISIKPKSRRLSSKVSMKHKERPQRESPLVEVKEEAAKQPAVKGPEQTGEVKPIQQKTVLSTTIPVDNPGTAGVSFEPKSEPREIPQRVRSQEDQDKSRARSLSPLSTSPVSTSMLQDVKLRPRPMSGKFEQIDTTKKEAETPNNELAKAFNRAKRISKKYDEDGNVVDHSATKPAPVSVVKEIDKKPVNVVKEVDKKPVNVVKENDKKPVSVVKESDKKQDSTAKPTQSASEEKPVVAAGPSSPSKVMPSSPTVTATSPAVSAMTGVSFVLKKEPLRPSNKTQEKIPDTSAIVTVPKDVSVIQPKEAAKPVNINAEVSKDKPNESPSKSQTPTKLTTGSPEKLASPRDDYRLKRAARSKTLPVSKEMLDKAEEKEDRQSGLPKRASSPTLERRRQNDYENVVIGTGNIQSKRSSWAPSSAASGVSAEPAWVVRGRLKQMEAEKATKEEKNDTTKKELKTDWNNVSQSSSLPATKIENQVANEAKVLQKPASSGEAKPVRTWAQTHSAKPFERSSTPSSVKPPLNVQASSAKNSFDRPSVQPTKPTIPGGSVKPTATTSAVKTSDKPVTQRPVFDSKVTPVGGVKSSAFERSFSQKSSVSQKPALDSNKTSLSSSVRPVASVTSAGLKSDTVKPAAGTDSRKVFVQDSKTVESDTRKDSGSSPAKVMPPKSSVSDKTTKIESSASVPAWKQQLSQRRNNPSQQVKIEIIDKDPVEKKVPEKKVEEKPSVQMREKQQKATPEKCSDIGNRSSKVLDMVKNFQKLQMT